MNILYPYKIYINQWPINIYCQKKRLIAGTVGGDADLGPEVRARVWLLRGLDPRNRRRRPRHSPRNPREGLQQLPQQKGMKWL